MSVVAIKPKTNSKKETKEEIIYDAIIIGGGPAGLTAGIYLSRARMNTLLIEKAMPGGQAILTEIIENYPGFPHGITGPELMQKMEEQAVRFGLKIEYGEAEEFKIKEDAEDKVKIVKINNQEYKTLTIILASGAEASKLKVPGEEELRGRGVSYCATCDAPFFKDQKIVVIGGGDTAIEEALYLTKFVREVTIIHRRDRLRATKILQERVFANKKIYFAWDSVVTKILGSEKVEGILIQNKKTGKEKEIPCQGVFIFVGNAPNSKFLDKLIKLDQKGYILTDDNMMTSQEGIYACGDVRKKILRQVVTACGEGATAAFAAQKYIEEMSKEFKRNGIKIISMHMPTHGADISLIEEYDRVWSVREVEKTALALLRLGGEILVVHPGSEIKDEKTRKARREKSEQSLEEILKFCEQWGIKIALENTLPGKTGDSIPEILEIVKKFDSKNLGICLDTGHCNITSSLYNHSGVVECLPEIKDYLCHLHIHDNSGKIDDHYLPFEGNIDWKRFIKGLKEINYQGVFMFELIKKTNNEEMLRTVKELYLNLFKEEKND